MFRGLYVASEASASQSTGQLLRHKCQDFVPALKPRRSPLDRATVGPLLGTHCRGQSGQVIAVSPLPIEGQANLLKHQVGCVSISLSLSLVRRSLRANSVQF